MKNWRLTLLQAFFAVFAAAILGRLFYWQIVRYDQFAAAASSQHLTTVSLGAERGKILASDGEILVSNQTSYLLYASLKDFKKAKPSEKTYEAYVKESVDRLTPALLEEKINLLKEPDKIAGAEKDLLRDSIKDSLIKSLTAEKVVWVDLGRKISEKTKDQIEALKIAGLGFEEQSSRFYPNGSLASHLLGFVGVDADGNDKGYSGLEGFFDEQLRGRSGLLTEEVDAQGHPILAGLKSGAAPEDGFDIVTTIDRSVQYLVEKNLAEGVKKYNPRIGSVIVLDVETGQVLAMANLPSFDPAKWPSFEDKELRNSAIDDVYEPGSTFKLVTASAGLDSGAIKTDTICPCEGPIRVGGYEVQTWNNKYHPNTNVAQILQKSDNTGAAFIADRIGKEKFIDYVEKFGFGEKLGVDLQGEESGIIKSPQDWYAIDMVTAAFGQGISVTALQMVSAISAVANDGKLMKPYVVKEVRGQDKTIETKPAEIRQVIKPAVAAQMREILLSAVEEGEAKRLIPHGLRIGGKTGTAQIPIAGHYDPNKSVASFVGFGPVENPKFAMIVRYFEPTPIYGAETAEPTFFKIAQDLYSYWGIPIN